MTNTTPSFGRICEITIANLATDNQIKTSNLKVDFSIIKSQKASENKARITVYNLSNRSRGLIQTENNKSGVSQTSVELRFGYAQETNLKTIFRGKGEIVSEHKSPDWITTIDATDGLQEIKQAVVQKTYPAGTKVTEIYSDLMSAANLKKVISSSVQAVIPKSRTVSGDPLKEAEELAKTYGLKFDIQDEEGLLTNNDNSIDANIAVRIPLNQGTGLINSPRLKGDIVIAESLISGDFRPGNYVDLSSRRNPGLNGFYEIKRVDFKGDNFGGSCLAVLELQKSNFLPIYENITSIDQELLA